MSPIRRPAISKTELDAALFEQLDKGLREVFDYCVQNKHVSHYKSTGPDNPRGAAENARALMELHRNFTPKSDR